MDELKIISNFTRSLLSKLIGTVLRKKSGCEVDLKINNINATIIEGKTHIHLDLDIEMEKEELLKLLKKVGV